MSRRDKKQQQQKLQQQYQFVDYGPHSTSNFYSSNNQIIQNTAKSSSSPISYQQGQQRFLKGYDRFYSELDKDGLEIYEIKGDGSCMYHSIADQLEQLNPGEKFQYLWVKNRILKYIENNAAIYAQSVENNDIEGYLQKKRRPGTWGGLMELNVATQVFKVNVRIYDTTDPTWELKAFEGNDVPTILLSYHGNMHYNSLRKAKNFLDNKQQPSPEQRQKEQRKRQFDDALKNAQLEIVRVLGKGNCLFRAVADQLQALSQCHQQEFPEYSIDHEAVKSNVLNYMEQNKEKYISESEDSSNFDRYIRYMREPNADGTEAELKAVAELYKVNIQVFCTDQDHYKIEPSHGSDKCIFLSYHDNNHYNSLEKIEKKTGAAHEYSQYAQDIQIHQKNTIQDTQRALVTNIDQQENKVQTDLQFSNQCPQNTSTEEQQPPTHNGEEPKNQVPSYNEQPSYQVQSPNNKDEQTVQSQHYNSNENNLGKIKNEPPHQSHFSQDATDTLITDTIISNDDQQRENFPSAPKEISSHPIDNHEPPQNPTLQITGQCETNDESQQQDAAEDQQPELMDID